MIAVEEPRVSLRFAGRRSGSEKGGSLERLAAELAPEAPPLAWARQVHSAIVLEARAGLCGEGDALFTERTDLALGVVTADCVPVLLAGARAIGAAHAGWRGLAAGILPRTVERLAQSFGEQPAELQAWIGPAIGPCCYEVSDEVADQVARASTRRARRPGTGERPVLDLHLAAAAQLAQAGLVHVAAFGICTRCHPENLWSYRRDAAGAGRNLSFIWRKIAADDLEHS